MVADVGGDGRRWPGRGRRRARRLHGPGGRPLGALPPSTPPRHPDRDFRARSRSRRGTAPRTGSSSRRPARDGMTFMRRSSPR